MTLASGCRFLGCWRAPCIGTQESGRALDATNNDMYLRRSIIKFLTERKLLSNREDETMITEEAGLYMQVILINVILCATSIGNVWVSIYMSMSNLWKSCDAQNLPMTAIPVKFAEARSVGGLLASPINWL